jgi:UDP-glucose 4-epimerase
MRIFLTGGSGFIGQHLMSHLRDHDVLCLTRQPNSLVAWPFAEALSGDLSDPEAWYPRLAAFGAQCCIHLAWDGLPDYSPERCRLNFDASSRLIEVLPRAGVPRIVVAGSCWEYGAASGGVRETQPPADCGLFAETKNALRAALQSSADRHKLDYRWARIFFAYGPGQRQTSLIPLCRSAFRAGAAPDIRSPEAVNDFVHVDDVARGILALALSVVTSGIYNLGSGLPVTVADVVNRVARYYGARPPYESLPRGRGFWSDNEKTFAAIRWTAETSLADGIAATLDNLDKVAA